MDDMMSRFSGVVISDPQEQWDNDFRRQKAEAEWGYRQSALARADASERREEALVAEHDSVFSGVKNDIDGGKNTPGAMAYGYPELMSEIKTLVRGGDLETANSRMQALRQSADRDNATYRTYATVRPANEFEKAVNAGGLAMSQYRFWDVPLQMSDGTTVLAGDLFRDGQRYKSFQGDRLVQSKFTEDFASAYRESSGFKKRMLSMISDPVTNPSASVAFSNLHAGGNPLVWRPEDGGGHDALLYSDLGDYVVREWDSMVEELGERGVERLIKDAVQNRVGSGTAIETIGNVRDWVYAQRQGANGASLDGHELVRRGLGEFDRLSASVSADGKPTDKERRLVSKVISSVVEGQKIGANNVDFSDPAVRERMDSLVNVFRMAEELRIPLLVEGNERGTDMRAAFADYVTGEPSEANFVRQVKDMFDTTNLLLTGGWTAVRGEDGKASRSSGNYSVDSMARGMWSELAKECVSRMGSGVRGDLAIASAVSDSRDDLVARWAGHLSSKGGLTPKAAAVVADLAMDEMSSGGGVRPVNLKNVLIKASGSGRVDAGTKAELMRWYKATEMANSVLDRYRGDYYSMLMDKTIGPGFTKDQADGMWAKACMDATACMGRGIDPSGPMDRLVNSFPVYRPTGNWIIPGGGAAPVSDETHEKMGREFAAGKSQVMNGGTPVDIHMFRAYRPEVEYSGKPEDLRKVGVGALRGVSVGVSPGAWMDPANRASFLSYQRMLKKAYEDNVRETGKAGSRNEKAYEEAVPGW